ncbi:MAG TPA: CocE/NonD family hydrolase [Nocardioides sp.]|nr:CocE/NonD family hydrolase [Nocardioides sp.]
MRPTRLVAAAAALLLPAALVPLASHADAAASYTVTTLHFKVVTGPANDQVCDILGDVYVPASATPATPAPAILATNGFGGSKDDLASDAASFADHGYVVLAYSGLGFGGSSCKITLDDPDWDGKAGSQLVSYLGGADGIGYADADHTQPVPPLTVVQRDNKDHLGNKSTNDPRVGMIGGSYGGQIQFAVASVDPRLDTIIPEITWNDLSYSLDPNNTDQTSGVSTRTPGAAKLIWAAGFSAEGLTGDLQNQQTQPDAAPCPNFADWVCPALVSAGTTGYLPPEDIARLRHASVASYMSKIKIPTLLMQGQNDTLFNLNEAVATYQALRAQGTPVKMIWKEGGHSGPAASGEFDYLTPRIYGWFDHYLKGQNTSTGPAFAYFRDWVSYAGSAVPAYASSTSFPVGTSRTWRLSGAGALTSGTTAAPGSQSFVTPAAGAPTSVDELDVLGGYTGQVPQTVNDDPGTFAAWTSPVLTSDVDVVGSPVVQLKVDAPTAAVSQATGPGGMLVLFVKVSDVGPDGTSRLIHGLEAPVRIPDVTKPFTIRLPGIVHRFAAGHQLRLTVAGGSANYRGGLTAVPVTIASGSTQTLTLPVVP